MGVRVTTGTHTIVIPAKAGIQLVNRESWIPAFAGMTKREKARTP
jgi:hypothetical protein